MKNVPKYLTDQIFAALAGAQSLEEFELWLYQQNDLAERMNERYLLDLFAFNYKGKDALYDFRALIKSYYREDDFMKYLIKGMLLKIAHCETLQGDTIEEINSLWRYNDLDFLRPLGMILYEIDDLWGAPDKRDSEYLKEISRKTAREILVEFEAKENLPGFNLSDINYSEPQNPILSDVNNAQEIPYREKKWWEFWK